MLPSERLLTGIFISKSTVHGHGCVPGLRSGDVAIDVQCCLNLTVAQKGRHSLGGYSFPEQDGRARVAKVMNPEGWQAGRP